MKEKGMILAVAMALAIGLAAPTRTNAVMPGTVYPLDGTVSPEAIPMPCAVGYRNILMDYVYNKAVNDAWDLKVLYGDMVDAFDSVLDSYNNLVDDLEDSSGITCYLDEPAALADAEELRESLEAAQELVGDCSGDTEEFLADTLLGDMYEEYGDAWDSYCPVRILCLGDTCSPDGDPSDDLLAIIDEAGEMWDDDLSYDIYYGLSEVAGVIESLLDEYLDDCYSYGKVPGLEDSEAYYWWVDSEAVEEFLNLLDRGDYQDTLEELAEKANACWDVIDWAYDELREDIWQ